MAFAEETKKVSVIVCAKNEAENLIINDSSSDETLEVMEDFQLRDSRVVIVNVESNERFWGNKKYALTLGIKKAKFEHLLFTDADCRPNSSQWISQMAKGFQQGKSIVLGYGGYEYVKNSFLNKLIRYETLLTALQYFSSAKNHKAYMGVGRNLAYTATEFYENNGFVSHMDILSGDDDLFINQIATKTNTSLIFDPESFTYSPTKNTWTSWFRQKRRHVSTANYYKKTQQFKLGLFYASQFLFWVLSFLLLAIFNWQLVLLVFLARTLVLYFSFYQSSKLFEEKGLLWLLPIQDLILVLAQFAIFTYNSISKPVHWK